MKPDSINPENPNGDTGGFTANPSSMEVETLNEITEIKTQVVQLGGL